MKNKDKLKFKIKLNPLILIITGFFIVIYIISLFTKDLFFNITLMISSLLILIFSYLILNLTSVKPLKKDLDKAYYLIKQKQKGNTRILMIIGVLGSFGIFYYISQITEIFLMGFPVVLLFNGLLFLFNIIINHFYNLDFKIDAINILINSLDFDVIYLHNQHFTYEDFSKSMILPKSSRYQIRFEEYLTGTVNGIKFISVIIEVYYFAGNKVKNQLFYGRFFQINQGNDNSYLIRRERDYFNEYNLPKDILYKSKYDEDISKMINEYDQEMAISFTKDYTYLAISRKNIKNNLDQITSPDGLRHPFNKEMKLLTMLINKLCKDEKNEK